jgi:hypothetical protein
MIAAGQMRLRDEVEVVAHEPRVVGVLRVELQCLALERQRSLEQLETLLDALVADPPIREVAERRGDLAVEFRGVGSVDDAIRDDVVAVAVMPVDLLGVGVGGSLARDRRVVVGLGETDRVGQAPRIIVDESLQDPNGLVDVVDAATRLSSAYRDQRSVHQQSRELEARARLDRIVGGERPAELAFRGIGRRSNSTSRFGFNGRHSI